MLRAEQMVRAEQMLRAEQMSRAEQMMVEKVAQRFSNVNAERHYPSPCPAKLVLAAAARRCSY
jgi:hypothetical protein